MVKTGHVEASINFLDALERAKVIHPAASAKARAAADVNKNRRSGRLGKGVKPKPW